MSIEPSGAVFDWRATRRLEREPRHPYHVTLVDKFFLCEKPNPQTGAPLKVHCTFAEALERIRKVAAMTRGMPKIVYLVGWQYEGHDSKYPAWWEVNERLKRPEDPSALASLLWLMREARAHDTTVSVHVNMNDAYENSPDWEEYRSQGLIEGKGGVWGGEQCWLISHAREWESGLARRRIDRLLEMLPIAEAGTVHVDAFMPVGPDVVGELAAMRRIVRYWRDCGVDVTIEDIPPGELEDGLLGIVPMVWHLNPVDWGRGDEFPEERYMETPPWVYCGCVDHSPRARLFGSSMQGEDLANAEIDRYLGRFCLNTLPWQYLNRHMRLTLQREGDESVLRLSDALEVRVRADHVRIAQADWLLRDGDDVFVPALWQNTPEIIAYSATGYARREWRLPPEWRGLAAVDMRPVTAAGLGEARSPAVRDGAVTLSLAAGEAASLTAAGIVPGPPL